MRKTLATLVVLLFCTGCPRDRSSAQIENDITALVRRTQQDCGVTWSLANGNQDGSGYFVTGAYPEAGEIDHGFPDAKQIRGFIKRHASQLRARNNVFGAWCVTPKGDCHASGQLTCYLDISRETDTLEQAAHLAGACNQISLARLGKDKVEIIDSFPGVHFGDGSPISGAALNACKKARGE